MNQCFHQLAGQCAGGSCFGLLCARPLGFAGQAWRRAMRLRATSSPARRFVAGVEFTGAALAYVPAFAARRGFGRHLRATNLPERVGAQPGVLRSMRALGRRFAARLQSRRERRGCVESFAATRGDLSRFLRVDEGSLANVAGGSTKGSARRFRNGRLSCGAPGSLITPQRRTKAKKRLTMALQRTAPRVTVAAIPVRCRLVRSWRSLTSVAAIFVPPSQLPRRAPQSLSLVVRPLPARA